MISYQKRAGSTRPVRGQVLKYYRIFLWKEPGNHCTLTRGELCTLEACRGREAARPGNQASARWVQDQSSSPLGPSGNRKLLFQVWLISSLQNQGEEQGSSRGTGNCVWLCVALRFTHSRAKWRAHPSATSGDTFAHYLFSSWISQACLMPGNLLACSKSCPCPASRNAKHKAHSSRCPGISIAPSGAVDVHHCSWAWTFTSCQREDEVFCWLTRKHLETYELHIGMQMVL